MKIIMDYYPDKFPPRLGLTIHGAPHGRQHRAILQQYREALVAIAKIEKVPIPLSCPIYLTVLYVNPTSPDIDHLDNALFSALDGKTLKGPSVLVDDRQIWKITVSKFYPNEKTKAENR